MISRSTPWLAALALTLALCPRTAAAQDLGIGGGVTFGTAVSGPLGGLELTYWLDDNLALDFYGTFGVAVPDVGDSIFGLGLGAGILYALIQGDDTKLELGARGGVLATITTANDADLFLDVLLRVEHWFDNHFTMHGQVGVSAMGDPDAAGGATGFSLIFGAQVTLGMTFYIDGNARPGEGGAESAPVVSSGGGGGNGGGTSSPPPSSSGGSEPPPDPESGAAGW